MADDFKSDYAETHMFKIKSKRKNQVEVQKASILLFHGVLSLKMWVEIRYLASCFLSLIDLWAFFFLFPPQFSKVTKLASIHLNLFAP